MAVYREGYDIIGKLLRAQTAVFSDAADCGVPVTKGNGYFKMVGQLVEGYGVENTRKVDRETVYHDIELIDEWAVSDERKTLSQATDRYRVSYTNLRQWKKHPSLLPNFRGEQVIGFITVERL